MVGRGTAARWARTMSVFAALALVIPGSLIARAHEQTYPTSITFLGARPVGFLFFEGDPFIHGEPVSYEGGRIAKIQVDSNHADCKRGRSVSLFGPGPDDIRDALTGGRGRTAFERKDGKPPQPGEYKIVVDREVVTSYGHVHICERAVARFTVPDRDRKVRFLHGGVGHTGGG